MPYADPEVRKAYHRAYNQEWYAKNKEKKQQQRRAHYQGNRESELATNRLWGEANKESIRERKRLYYAEHRQEILDRCHKYIAKNIASRRARGRAYAKNNRDKYNAVKNKRRAAEANSGGSYTAAEWRALVSLYNHRCLRCKRQEPEIKLSADHVIPVILGGTSYIVPRNANGLEPTHVRRTYNYYFLARCNPSVIRFPRIRDERRLVHK